MSDRDLPHEKLRLGIFWVLFGLWPVLRVIWHIWHPVWVSDASDIGAAVTATSFMLGKFLFQDTQARLSRKAREHETLLTQIRDSLTITGVMPERALRLIRPQAGTDGAGADECGGKS